MDWPTISVIVLNYNGRRHLKDCFSSLLSIDYPRDRYEILLVDNASWDDSIAFIEEFFPSVTVMRNSQNLGFAGGNNEGARAAKGEYLAFLNNDTRVDTDWLKELVKPCLEEEKVICTGSRILSWDGETIDFADGAFNFLGWGFQVGFGSKRLKDFERDKDLLFVCGGALLIKREVFLSIDGFDADFFAFFEDVDLGWRLWLMGYKNRLAARSIVYHRHHGSWDSVQDTQRWVLYERNALFTIIKNYEEAHLYCLLPVALLLTLERIFFDITAGLKQQGKTSQLLNRAIRKIPFLPQSFFPSGFEKRFNNLSFFINPNNRLQIPSLALSRLAACRQVLRVFPSLEGTRRIIQAGRQCSDTEIFPLFQTPLLSNFGDPRFIQIMNQLINRFEINQLFQGKEKSSDSLSQLVEPGRRLSLEILNVLDRIWELMKVPEEPFQLGQTPPPELFSVPTQGIALLVAMNNLIEAIPNHSLKETMSWLLKHCQRLLDSYPLPD
jgi:GT2 family glycosyltransferase